MKAKILFVLMIIAGISRAQKESGRSYNMFWLGYYSYVQLNEKWYINSDIQHRTRDGFETQSQSLIRTAAAYKINDLFTLSAGAAHFRYYIKNDLTRGEWRPWQEISGVIRHGKIKVTNKLRTEERFNQVVVNGEVTNDYQFNWRFRYRVDVDFPLFKQNDRAHSLSVGNEFMINAGKSIINPFDQNRSSVAFNYQLSKNVRLQFQYIFIVQYVASRNAYDDISVFRFNIHHTIKL
jgi:hypothetical protein